MPYITRTIRAGNKIIIEKTYSGRYGKKKKHNEKVNETPEDVKIVNERNRIKKLYRIMLNNFDFGDYHQVLTYKKENRPAPEEAKKIVNKLLEKLRKEYKKRGKQLKYILVTEYKNKAIHHHIIMNEIGGTPALVKKHWSLGGAYATVLYENGEFEDLAAYLVKETKETFKDKENPNKLSYTCSRNLIKPEEKVEVIDSENWLEVPVPNKGYWIRKESVVTGVSEITGYGYQYYEMVRYRKEMDAEEDSYYKPRRKKV